MNSQGKMKAQVWSLILLVFVLGGVTGAALDRLLVRTANSNSSAPTRRGGPGRMVENMKKDLNLTPAQEQQVRAILDESRKEFKDLGEKAGFKEARERSRARLRAVLNPDQQTKFDEMNARHDEEMKKREEADRK